MNYQTKNRSKYLLLYHVILVCKYRKKVLKKYGEEIKQIMHEIADISDFEIETIEVDEDHVHILVISVPKLSPISIVRRLKQTSTRMIWKKNFNDLSLLFWKERTFWSDGYFISSIGNASESTIRRYIENQG